MSGSSTTRQVAPVQAEGGFDRQHLARYTMDNADLEREIIGLFLQQLPAIVETLKVAASRDDWRMAAHTLKGSAAAVGATAIHESALELEQVSFAANVNVKNTAIQTLDARVDRFRRIVAGLYGAF
jgi:HPt (histidine-containing phosphotransfer) domain-containing protein